MEPNWKLPGLKKQQTDYQTDYNEYRFSLAEWILYLLEGGCLIGLIGYCFYDSVVAMIFLSPGIIWFLKIQKETLKEKRQAELRMEFKDAVLCVSANQKAGYSVENSFLEAYEDMRMLYGENSMICEELAHIGRGLKNNMVLETMLLSLGERSGIDDIREFAEVFAIAKRSGGNLTGIIAMTASVIEEKVAVEQEVSVLISAKKMEASIMNFIPFLIILYMDATSDGFFDVLYHNLIGIIIMTVCLVVYAAAFFMSRKIVSVRV